MKRYEVWFLVDNTYKYKLIHAVSPQRAIERARVANIVDVIEID